MIPMSYALQLRGLTVFNESHIEGTSVAHSRSELVRTEPQMPALGADGNQGG